MWSRVDAVRFLDCEHDGDDDDYDDVDAGMMYFIKKDPHSTRDRATIALYIIELILVQFMYYFRPLRRRQGFTNGRSV